MPPCLSVMHLFKLAHAPRHLCSLSLPTCLCLRIPTSLSAARLCNPVRAFACPPTPPTPVHVSVHAAMLLCSPCRHACSSFQMPSPPFPLCADLRPAQYPQPHQALHKPDPCQKPNNPPQTSSTASWRGTSTSPRLRRRKEELQSTTTVVAVALMHTSPVTSVMRPTPHSATAPKVPGSVNRTRISPEVSMDPGQAAHKLWATHTEEEWYTWCADRVSAPD